MNGIHKEKQSAPCRVRGAIDDELHFVRCYTFLFPFIFAILYVRLCNIVSLSFRGCYMHTLVYISMCVYHQEAYSCWYPIASRKKKKKSNPSLIDSRLDGVLVLPPRAVVYKISRVYIPLDIHKYESLFSSSLDFSN